MKIKRNLILVGAWLVDILLLLIIILVPKTNGLYDKLFPVFQLSIFVIPILLILIQVFLNREAEQTDKYLSLPCLGCSLLMLLTVVRFISTIELDVVFQMMTILVTFILLELLIGYLAIVYKKYTIKKHLIIGLLIYASLILFYFCAMIMSYDHSIMW